MHPFQALSIPAKKIGIHWFGQSSFAIKDPSGTIVQIDPYFPIARSPSLFIHPDSPLNETTLKTDYVLLTHDHEDHTCIESLLRIHSAFPKAQYIGPPESISRLAGTEIPEELLTKVTAGDQISLGKLTVHSVWAKPQEGVPKERIQPPDVQHLGYVLSGPVNLYISGDPINTFSEHDELLQPIASLQPEIGLLTTHPTEGEFPFFSGSVETALKLGLESVIPAHYACFAKRTYNPNDWVAAFPEFGPRQIIIPYNDYVVYPD